MLEFKSSPAAQVTRGGIFQTAASISGRVLGSVNSIPRGTKFILLVTAPRGSANGKVFGGAIRRSRMRMESFAVQLVCRLRLSQVVGRVRQQIYNRKEAGPWLEPPHDITIVFSGLPFYTVQGRRRRRRRFSFRDFAQGSKVPSFAAPFRPSTFLTFFGEFF